MTVTWDQVLATVLLVGCLWTAVKLIRLDHAARGRE